jgi:hypothetical protein
MPDRHSNTDMEKLLSSLGTEISEMESILPFVRDRLSQESVAPRRRFHPVYGGLFLATAAVLAFAILAFRPLHRTVQTPENRATVAVVVPPAPAMLQLDGITIVQRFAFQLDARAVVAAWSCNSPQHNLALPEASLLTPLRRDGYTEIPLRSAIAPDGTVYQCSLFIADLDVTPSFQPPSMTIRLPQRRFVGLGASLKRSSPSELMDALKLAGLPGVPPLSVTEVQNAMRLYNSSPRG